MSEENLHDIYQRLSGVETQGGNLETRVAAVESTLVVHGGKLDKIVDAVSQHRSFKPSEIISTVLQLFLLIGSIITVVIYIASNIYASDIAVLEYRLDQMETAGKVLAGVRTP